MFGEAEQMGRVDVGRFRQWAHLLAFAGDESRPKARPFAPATSHPWAATSMHSPGATLNSPALQP